MKIERITYNLFYPKIEDIRREFLSIEEQLKEHFVLPFNLLPLPNDAPVEIPRITAKSKHNHSELQMSLVNTKLLVSFDENYSTDIEKCLNYLKERIYKVTDVLSKFSDGKFLFSGITTNIIFEKDNPINLLTEHFSKLNSNIEPYNVSNKYTYLKDNIYFINITIENLRKYQNVLTNNLSYKPTIKELSHNLLLTLDLNDKYAYNHNNDYFTNEESIHKLLAFTEKFLKEKAVDIVEGKELEL